MPLTKYLFAKGLVLLFSLAPLYTAAQKEGSIWYFGRNAGLSFNTTPPTLLYDGNLNTLEGCATMSDKQGQLLFYTDGVRVWNRNRTYMPNGNGLKGSMVSTQSALIVPWPGESSRYFLFTVSGIEDAVQAGLNYSIVDLSLDSGRGDVTAKNVNLFMPGTEKLAAIKHGNGRDYWVVSHAWNSDTFYSYLVNCHGIVSIPVKTKIGTSHTGPAERATGQMKISSNGRYAAVAIGGVSNNMVEVFRFDNVSGVFSDLKKLNYGGLSRPYGIEFSSNNEFLYISDLYTFKIEQFEVGNYANLAATRTEVGSTGVSPGSLQLAPNGKIYIAQHTTSYLSVIHLPDQRGPACSFQNNALYLDDRMSTYGLPGFVQSYFIPDAIGVSDFTHVVHCDSTHFYTLHKELGMTWDWDFGDGNIASDSSPVHFYNDTGHFTVRLITAHSVVNCDPLKKDTSFHIVHITQPGISLGSDVMACHPGYTGILECNFIADGYQWSTGETSKSIQVKPNITTYWLQSLKDGCYQIDTVNVFGQFGDDHIFETDTLFLCEGDSIRLNPADSVNAAYTWSNGANTASLLVTQPGLYWIEQHAGDCHYTDTTIVAEQLRPVMTYAGDTVYCVNDNAKLTLSGATQYKWTPQGDLLSDTGAVQEFTAGNTLVYLVRGGDTSCFSEIVISVKVQNPPDPFVIPGDLCFVKGMKISGPDGDWTYNWSTGETTRVIIPSDSGRYDLVLTNGCGQVSDSIRLYYTTAADCRFFVPNAFRPASSVNGTFPFVSGEGYGISSFGDCQVSYYKLVVFTRWGEMVFESDQLANTWNGLLKDGSPADVGVYGYSIEAKYVSNCGNYSGMVESFRGSVTLLR